MSPIGEFPSHLYRSFDKEEYAREFVEQGRFRIGLLEKYKQIESNGSRSDPDEGISCLQLEGNVSKVTLNSAGGVKSVSKEPGYVDSEMTLINLKYILCCSGPDVDMNHLKEKYGEYIIRLNNPCSLAQEIASYFRDNSIPIIGKPKWAKVRYDKGSISKEQLTNEEHVRLSYSQKAPKFANDKEYRLVVIMSGVSSRGNHITVDLGKKLDYIRVHP